MKVGSDRPVACLPPHAPRKPARLVPPPGAWDTHAHVIATEPWVSPRNYDPPEATIDQYVALLDGLGLSNGVLVQVSVHGTDNGALLDGLRRLPDRLRGVVAVKPDISDLELDQMHEAGVRGVRILEVLAGGVSLDMTGALARRIARLGWHVEFALHGSTLERSLPVLMDLPVPIVIAHFGDCDLAGGIAGPQFQALTRLVQAGRCHVKLSGAYRLSPRRWADVADFARALIEVAPDRLVWGSDWPHVAINDPELMPRTEDLLDLLVDWTQDEAVLKRILVDNPGALYR